MKYLFALAFLLLAQISFGQVLAQDLNVMKPKKDFTNVETVTLHSDENTTVFMIYIKQAVRKHVHQYHTEVITVLDGKGRMYLGGEYFDISKGDHIVIPPNTAHAVITTSSKPLKVMSVQSPQFLGEDRIFIEDDVKDTERENDGGKKKKNTEEEIPEFEEDN